VEAVAVLLRNDRVLLLLAAAACAIPTKAVTMAETCIPSKARLHARSVLRSIYLAASAAGGQLVDAMTRGQRLIKNNPKEAIVERIVLTRSLSSPDPHVPCPLGGCQRAAQLRAAASGYRTRHEAATRSSDRLDGHARQAGRGRRGA
jgi:hypothetical protein